MNDSLRMSEKDGSGSWGMPEIWLVPKGSDHDSLIQFLKAVGPIQVRVEPGFLAIRSASAEEELNIAHLREKCVEELFQDFAALVLPKSPGFSETILVPALMKLSAGVYQVPQLIEKVSLMNLQPAKQWLRHYYQNLSGPDVLATVLGFIEANQNASKTAKALYMHRNTVNYRLDLFIRKSGIDIRNFYPSYVLYLLYHS